MKDEERKENWKLNIVRTIPETNRERQNEENGDEEEEKENTGKGSKRDEKWWGKKGKLESEQELFQRQIKNRKMRKIMVVEGREGREKKLWKETKRDDREKNK